MSKASAWAQAYDCVTRIRATREFIVDTHGYLEMGGWSLTPKEAIKFARWILSIYEEDSK